MDGMEATKDLFINLIQNNRIIYDKSLKEFKNTRKKEEVWQNIAKQSRMTVENAKKRYASLRQKYTREKRKCDVNRRYKIAASSNWVLFERMHFLDSFIQPKSTYTNDRFVEEDEDDTPDGYGIDNSNEVGSTGDASQRINIEVEDGIDVDECENLQSDGQLQLDNVQLDSHVNFVHRIDGNDSDHQRSDVNVWNGLQRIVSEYPQEESTVDYVSSVEPHVTSRENENSATTGVDDMEMQEQFENGQRIEDDVDVDNYMSLVPGTSSSFSQMPPYSSRFYDPKTVEIITTRAEKTVDHAKRNQSSSIRKPTKNLSTQPARSEGHTQPTTLLSSISFRSNMLQSTGRTRQLIASTASSNSNIAPISSSAANTVPTASASKEKQLDAIRHRMESCSTAITNKVSDKTQRSPHSPFLAYLGTKLPSVPKENLPRLEKEILDLVDQYI